MIREHENVVLVCDLPAHGLKAGDVGTVVLVYAEPPGYEVEFMTLGGDTVAVESVEKEKVRPVSRNEMSHARLMEKGA